MISISDADFRLLTEYMRKNYGINLEKKRSLIEGRLMTTIVSEGFEGFHDFLADVFSDKSGKKIDTLLVRLTTNYTYFMREDVHYKFMLDVALPEWTRKIRNRDLRIWSAGCSSGEEPYTAAMVVDTFFGAGKADWDSTILATDISPRVLSLATDGIYHSEHLEKLPEAWKTRYFTSVGNDKWQVKPQLKNEIVFGEFNLMDSFARFRRKFHIIFCRNVMIYFDNPTKAELAKKFYDVLEPGGYLFIGLSETLTGIFDGFTQVAPAIYRRDGDTDAATR